LNLAIIAGELCISALGSGNLPKVLGGENESSLIGRGFDGKENL